MKTLREIVSAAYREVSGELAKTHVAALSALHRIQASPGIREAAGYVAEQLERAGLTPEVKEYLSDGEREYLDFVSPVGWETTGGEVWMVKPKEKLIARFADVPTVVVAHSAPTDGWLEAEVVDVGEGDDAKFYEGIDVKGKLVLASSHPSYVHEEAVVKRGALGIVAYKATYRAPEATPCFGIWPTKRELERLGVAVSIPLTAAEEIKRHLRAGEKVVLKVKVNSRFYDGKNPVVTAAIRGSSRAEEEVWIIAHVCHSRPGANDNASGSGLLIEVARALRSLILEGKVPKPERTIRFVWVPEIDGTAALLEEFGDVKGRVIAAVNLDMVGENQAVCGSTLTVVATPLSLPSFVQALACSLLDAAVEIDAPTEFASNERLPTLRVKAVKYTGGSDHYVLSDPTVGVPCVALISWPDEFWHTSADTADKVDPKTLKVVGTAAASFALAVASASAQIGKQVAIETLSRSSQRLGAEVARALELAKEGSVWAAKVTVESWCEWLVESVKSVASAFPCDISEEVKAAQAIASAYRSSFESAARALGLDLASAAPPKLERASAVARRLKRGPVSADKLKRLLGEEYAWYRERSKKDEAFFTRFDELLYAFDGKRTLLEAYALAVAEHGPWDPAEVSRIVRDLEKLGYIALSE